MSPCEYCQENFGITRGKSVYCFSCSLYKQEIDENDLNARLDEAQNEGGEEMPNVNDLNEYLTASDVKDGDVISFVDAGELAEKDFSKNKDGSDMRTVLDITIKLPNGKTKKMNPNKTSRKTLSEKYTPDTENWVGKKAKVLLLKQNVGGSIKDVIYLEAV